MRGDSPMEDELVDMIRLPFAITVVLPPGESMAKSESPDESLLLLILS